MMPRDHINWFGLLVAVTLVAWLLRWYQLFTGDINAMPIPYIIQAMRQMVARLLSTPWSPSFPSLFFFGFKDVERPTAF